MTRLIRTEILGEITLIEADVAGGNPAAAQERWRRLLESRVYDGALFVGAKWSALEFLQHLPGSLLTGLSLPTPGAHDPAASVPGLPPSPAAFSDHDRLRLLLLKELVARGDLVRVGPHFETA